MAVDEVKVNEYLDEIKKIEASLDSKQELFLSDRYSEFRQVSQQLKKDVEKSKDDQRLLQIGIVGAVKAGKSSFLNACIFDGEEYLPKAATPMTAALTKISYSETPKAIIHFYTGEDWETIENKAAEYDKGLKQAYEIYCENRKKKADKKTGSAEQKDSHKISLRRETKDRELSFEEFEKTYECKSEDQRGAKELVRMVKDPALLQKLDDKDEIDGDIIRKLDDYVGAGGKYTPIVSYVELQVNKPNVKDRVIVDTPGLNDPIVSRSIVTKRFLRDCDVVILLSRCGQFMDAQTVSMMASSLPEAGVREILVVGSKLDDGVLNESDSDFWIASQKALTSYHAQFNKSLTQAKSLGRHLDVLEKMTKGKVRYISSICSVISRKLEKNEKLDETEQLVYDNLHTSFPNFEDKYLASLGGIEGVKEDLQNILERKEAIFDLKNSSLLDDARFSHLGILEKILTETLSSRKKLEENSAEELKQRATKIEDAIGSSRNKLLRLFEGAALKCDSKVQAIIPQLTIESGHHSRIVVKTTSHQRHSVEKTGWFKKEIVYFTVKEDKADASEVIDNIKMYSAKCLEYVNSEFNNIFNKAEFTGQIKDVVLQAFDQGDKDFDVDEMKYQLDNVLSEISIARIELDYTGYIDEVNTRFPEGYAKNNGIHLLSALQTRLIDEIEGEIVSKLKEALEEMTKTLKMQGVTFADRIKDEFCGELEKLESQIKEKDRYIEKYKEFAAELGDMKAKLLNM